MSADIKNNPMREMLANPVDGIVNYIDQQHPWVTPNMISLASAAGMRALNALAVKFPDHGFPIGVAQTGVVLGDMLDGRLADMKDMASLLGALLDSGLDHIGGIDHGLTLSRRAFNTGDKVGGVLHAAAGATSPLSAIARAYAESNGVAVKEGGLGTRPMTETFYIVNNALLHNRAHTAQALSAFMIGQKLYTAAERLRAPGNPDSKHHIGLIDDPEKIRDAKIRSGLLGVIFVGGAIVTARHLKKELSKDHESSQEETQANVPKPLLPKFARSKLAPLVGRSVIE